MKKLLILLMLSLMSFGSMAMGFPHSTFAQKRELISKSTAKRVDFVQKVENGILTNVEVKTSLVSTVIHSISNFFIALFSDSFSSGKELAKTDVKVKTTTMPTKKVLV